MNILESIFRRISLNRMKLHTVAAVGQAHNEVCGETVNGVNHRSAAFFVCPTSRTHDQFTWSKLTNAIQQRRKKRNKNIIVFRTDWHQASECEHIIKSSTNRAHRVRLWPAHGNRRRPQAPSNRDRTVDQARQRLAHVFRSSHLAELFVQARIRHEINKGQILPARVQMHGERAVAERSAKSRQFKRPPKVLPS